MACSITFRRKILEIKAKDGLSFEETTHRFGVSKSSVSRWAKRLEPCRTRSKPATKIDPGQLIRDAGQHPDTCQHERAERFGCSQRGLCEALKRLKISREKTFFHPEADEEARRLFKRKNSVYKLMRLPLIYIDESGFAEDMPRIFEPIPIIAAPTKNRQLRREKHQNILTVFPCGQRAAGIFSGAMKKFFRLGIAERSC